ncbi:hypothetical protein EYC80_006613 [Monilinia laxa]|uniref:Uncharacterized protein n=1 Tax=Monilinia laxa TaxID=61186 RepID=A0A5N6JV56_MONLA|nr:hypothetical protein EYC80_006613 [Monilinia laxa]
MEQKVFERGEIKQQFSDVPSSRIIDLDGDGIYQRLAGYRALTLIKCEAQKPQKAIKQNFISLEGKYLTQSQLCKATKRSIKDEPNELDYFPSSMAYTAQGSQSKRRRIHRDPEEPCTTNNARIKQELININAIAENACIRIRRLR